jgi:hypothetical protein
VQVPTPSRLTSTTSPSLSHVCGFIPIPTPCGLRRKSAKLVTHLEASNLAEYSRSSKDQITGQQRRPLTQKRNRLRNPKNHIRRIIVLHHLPIHLRRDLQRLGILNHVPRDNTWTERRPAIKALSKSPLAAAALELPVPVRDVVTHGIAEDVVERLGLWHIGTWLANDGNELAFPVEALAFLSEWVDGYGVCWAGDGRYRFVLWGDELLMFSDSI